MKRVILIALFLLTGCANVKFNGPETRITQIDRPEVGVITTAYVGDQLLQKGEVVEETVLQVNKLIDGVGYNIPQGTYPQVGYDDNNDYYSSVGVIKNPFADPFQALMLPKKDGAQLCVVTVFSATACYSGDYERKGKISERGSSFQQTLIYSGRVGNKIKMGYREFSSNLARPAFNNDVEYDLSVSSNIGYKGAQLEVINADNTSITYRVIKSFPLLR